MPTEPDNMMADLQSVVSKMREPAAEPDGVLTEAPPGETPEAAPEAGVDATPETKEDKTGRLHAGDGKFAPKPKETPAAKVAREPAKEAKKVPLAAVPKAPDGALTEPKPAETPAAPVVTTKAPTNWRPEVREKWGALPADVQAEINRREREVSVGLGQAAEAKKEAQRWRDTVAPFEMLFRADGVDAPRKVAGLLQLETALRTSPGPAKAGIVANIIRQFGVSVEDLASALDGTQTPQHVAPQQGAYRDPRVDQLFATLQHQAAQRQAQQQAEAEASLAKIRETNEFYEDLREDAADLLEASHRRGKPISIEEAFERAAKLNPEVSRVLAQRKDAADAKAKAAEAAKKRAAAGSIRSLPGGPPPSDDGPETDGSLRGDLEAMTRRLASR